MSSVPPKLRTRWRIVASRASRWRRDERCRCRAVILDDDDQLFILHRNFDLHLVA